MAFTNVNVKRGDTRAYARAYKAMFIEEYGMEPEVDARTTLCLYSPFFLKDRFLQARQRVMRGLYEKEYG